LAISAAVTGSFTPAKAALTALTCSDSVLGQASLVVEPSGWYSVTSYSNA
jgi:hypothetical protein